MAPPPGTIRPTAFPLNCAAATGNQARVCSAIRSSCHSQRKLAISHATTRTAKYQSRCISERHDEKTAIRLGKNRYSDAPATASSAMDLA